MSDYFDEMGWQPVEADRIQDHQTLLVARFLSDNGFFADGFDADQLPPPAAKHVVDNLPQKQCTVADEKCAICLKANTAESVQVDIFKVLPCSHAFHDSCILPWLEKVSFLEFPLNQNYNYFLRTQTNSCPLCRHEMLTDDAGYEERKKNRLRAREREEELETLHNSMFG